jgi:hypothetical protein
MSVRERLPGRRESDSFTFELGGLAFTATFSRFPGGGVGEVFLRNHRVDSGADIAANDAAIAASLALQHGCPLETLQRALGRDAQGRATGPLGRAIDLIREREQEEHAR